MGADTGDASGGIGFLEQTAFTGKTGVVRVDSFEFCGITIGFVAY